jgi:salicylate hydroxylase
MAADVARRSLVNGELFGLQLPGLDADLEPERLHEIGDAIKKNWEWAWTTSADPMLREATAMLEDALLTPTRAMM